jgi:hypothetical protein
MPRKTKAELEEERVAAQARQELEQIHWYRENLMPLMERACGFNYEITVKDNSFYLHCLDGYKNGQGYAPDDGYFILSLDYSDRSYWYLIDLAQDLDRRQAHKDEQERIDAAKTQALSKLTQEERKLLGL